MDIDIPVTDAEPVACPFDSFFTGAQAADGTVENRAAECVKWANAGYPCDLQEEHPDTFGVEGTVDCGPAKACGYCAFAGVASEPALWPSASECAAQPLELFDFDDRPASPTNVQALDIDDDGWSGCSTYILSGYSCDDLETRYGMGEGYCDIARACGWCDSSSLAAAYYAAELPSSDGALLVISISGGVPTDVEPTCLDDAGVACTAANHTDEHTTFTHAEHEGSSATGAEQVTFQHPSEIQHKTPDACVAAGCLYTPGGHDMATFGLDAKRFVQTVGAQLYPVAPPGTDTKGVTFGLKGQATAGNAVAVPVALTCSGECALRNDHVPVAQDCAGAWSQWSECDVSCGDGHIDRK